MDLYEWLLFLHVTAAFAVVTALTIYTVVLISVWSRDRPSEVAELFRLERPAGILMGAGAVALLVLGIWLAYVGEPDYGIFDEWIIAAIVLWALSAATGAVAGRHYGTTKKLAERLARENDQPSGELRAMLRSPRGVASHALASAAVAAMLVLMVFKPGAF